MDQFALWALIIGILSTISLPLGSLIGMTTRPSGRVVGPLAAFGGGALLAALSVELVAPTMLSIGESETGREYAIALLIGGVLGGVFFWLLDQLLNAHGGYLRKTATSITYLARSRRKRMKRLVAHLSNNQLFRTIPPSHIEMLLDRLRTVNFSPGEILFTEGSHGDRLYIIESGEIRLVRSGEEIGRLGEGDILGEIALLTSGVRTATATAASAVIAMELTHHEFDNLCKEAPEIGVGVRELASRRLAELGQRDALSAEASAKWAFEAASALRSGIHPPTSLELKKAAHSKSGAPLAIWLGITLDGIPECFVLGATVLGIIQRQNAGGTATLATVIPYTFLIGLILSNVPEALSSSVGLINQGWKKWKVMLLWISLVVIGSALTMLGYYFGEEVPHVVEVGAEGMAAGAMLTMIAQTMIPEAVHLGGASAVGLSTLAGFLGTAAFKLIEH
jgi:CRP-like cAMP-binding protein